MTDRFTIKECFVRVVLASYTQQELRALRRLSQASTAGQLLAERVSRYGKRGRR